MNDVTVCTAAFAGFKLNLALRWLETTHWLRRFLVQNAAEGEPVCVTDRVLADWQAGDLDGNGRLNAADLTLMKRELMHI